VEKDRKNRLLEQYVNNALIFYEWMFIVALEEIPNRNSCPYTPGERDGVVAFSPERGDAIQFNDKLEQGQQLLFRCSDVGFYRLKGSRKMVCRDGAWVGKQPNCVRLSPFDSTGESLDRVGT
jgi:hypothetical protein